MRMPRCFLCPTPACRYWHVGARLPMCVTCYARLKAALAVIRRETRGAA